MAFKKLKVKVGEAVGTHSNFPTLVQPSLITGLGSITLAEAQSARFYSDVGKTTELAREVVGLDEIHVKVTSMEALAEIWMDYDGIRADYAVSATYGRNAVWSDYLSVQHMQSDQTDSSGNLSPTQSGITYTAGKLGIGGDFESTSSSQINFGDPASFHGMTGLTLQTWLKPESFTNFGMITAKGDIKSWEFRNTGTTGRINFTIQTNSGLAGLNNCDSTLVMNTGQWYATHAVFDSSLARVDRTRIYTDAVLTSANSYNGSRQGTTVNNSTDIAYLGRRGDGFYWDGMMDEFRIRASALSPNWITTEYNNQNANGSFWEATDAGGGGSTPAQAARRGVIMMM